MVRGDLFRILFPDEECNINHVLVMMKCVAVNVSVVYHKENFVKHHISFG
jgi:hypothetical protein